MGHNGSCLVSNIFHTCNRTINLNSFNLSFVLLQRTPSTFVLLHMVFFGLQLLTPMPSGHYGSCDLKQVGNLFLQIVVVSERDKNYSQPSRLVLLQLFLFHSHLLGCCRHLGISGTREARNEEQNEVSIPPPLKGEKACFTLCRSLTWEPGLDFSNLLFFYSNFGGSKEY